MCSSFGWILLKCPCSASRLERSDIVERVLGSIPGLAAALISSPGTDTCKTVMQCVLSHTDHEELDI